MTNTKRPRDLEADEVALFEAVDRHMASVADRVGPCPDPSQLLLAYAGELSDEHSAPILAHAAGCPLCQTLVEVIVEPASEGLDPAAVRRLDARIGGAATDHSTVAKVLTFPRRWRGGIAAAALAAAAVLLVFVVPDTSIDPATLPAVSLPRAARPAGRSAVGVLRAERLATDDMGVAALSWRGDAAGAPPAPAFDAARQAFDRGEYAESEQRLADITAHTPAMADAWLLLGVSRLLLGRAPDAIAPLTRARETLVGVARDDADWHLAVALHSVGRIDEARAALAPLCTGRAPRAALACLALDELRGP